jgi:hypothetical protein
MSGHAFFCFAVGTLCAACAFVSCKRGEYAWAIALGINAAACAAAAVLS